MTRGNSSCLSLSGKIATIKNLKLFNLINGRILLRTYVFDGISDFGRVCLECLDYYTTFFSGNYAKHAEALIHTAFDDGCGATNSVGVKFYESFFRFRLSNLLMQYFLQHLYTYQKLTNTKIYDEYKNWVLLTKKLQELYDKINNTTDRTEKSELQKIREGLKKQEQSMREDFFKIFEELHSKATHFYNPPLGACKECLKHTGSKWFKYSKWLKQKEKSDSNAWNHKAWS